ncbi:50S ribosomal protein L4 [Candidatus Uhrbacteria bacterium]|nr:50S ribosomal protein L4 [Candidatus Uhrbacteria bacterium]
MGELKAKVYNEEGRTVGEVKLDPAVFAVAGNSSLLHQAVTAQQANARKPIAHTKDRGEVSGGGKKPWKQKGTGRARHGSIRSPIWVGGGVTFGPNKDRNFGVKINKKMKRKALLMCLSDKAAESKVIVLDKFAMEDYKTSRVAKLLKNLSCVGGTIFVLPGVDQVIKKSAQNIPRLQTAMAGSLNAVDLLKAKNLLTTSDGLEAISKLWGGKTKAKKISKS